MRGIVSTLLIAAAAMLFMAQGASAAWKCTAYTKDGVYYGYGTANDKGAASVIAMLNCAARGGGCRITGCEGSDPPVARPTPTPACPPGQQRNDAGRCYTLACPPGQQRNDAGRCYEVVQRCPDGSRMPDSGRCPKKEPVVQYCPNGQRMPSSGRCPEKTCLEGQLKNAAGDCYTVSNPTPPPAPAPTEVKIKCDLGPVEGYPASGDLPYLQFGSTLLFASGYADVAPNSRDCKGMMANGCYLRVTNVQKVSGGSGQACVQFCKTELCPKTPLVPPQEIARIPTPLPPPAPAGRPAVLTLIAPPYVMPQPQGKPAAPTVIAAPYVEPAAKGRPAVPTVIAAPVVEPAAKGRPAVPTVIAAPVVEPAANR